MKILRKITTRIVKMTEMNMTVPIMAGTTKTMKFMMMMMMMTMMMCDEGRLTHEDNPGR